MAIKVRLLSNFIDYYDHHFDGYTSEMVFERKSTGGMRRQEMLEYLKSLKLNVPLFGKPAEICNQLRQRYNMPDDVVDFPQYVVIHLDETAHCGEGKIRLPLNDALKSYPDHLAVEYIFALPSGLGQSWRYLQIGDKKFWLRYTSKNDWRSNYGDVEIEMVYREEDGYHPEIDAPLFAIDFIVAQGEFYAIDFNIAPGIKGTGIENTLHGREVVEAIKWAIKRRKYNVSGA